MTGSRIQALGIPWYERDSYKRVLEVMEDAHLLPPTFEAWQYRAHKTERSGQITNAVVVRAVIDPDEFVIWCQTRNFKIDAEARMAFANEAAYDAISKTR
ncbi:hypothetical protein [Rhodopseudomonas sp.]|uniref:hypothetical protein n=1 Tax=Rhodopseudomonas sp. TaxID=1078 RepID=UPI003B3AD0A2